MRPLTSLILIAPLLLLPACRSAPKETREVDVVVRDVPSPLGGTIGSMSRLVNVDPVFVTGYGVVVDLPGTGDTTADPAITASVIRHMGILGITSDSPFLRGSRYQGMTPSQILADRSTAVVQVIGAIPPGLPPGSVFDVYVVPAPGSTATSIENGHLWPTDLDVAATGRYEGFKTATLAEAQGTVFVTAFTTPPHTPGELPADDEGAEINRLEGRVLNGGRVKQSKPIELFMDNPSFDRARAMTAAINTRFPQGPGDQGPAARGRDMRGLRLSIPKRFQDRPEDFVLLVQHMQIEQAYPDQFAIRYVRDVREHPSLAVNLSWCMEAVGERMIPYLRELYDDPQIVPRMAGLRAGARLGDVRAVEGLADIAKDPRSLFQLEAIDLLADLDRDGYPVPQIDMTLIELVERDELAVRVEAGLGLMRRAERSYWRKHALLNASLGSADETKAILTKGARFSSPFPPEAGTDVSRVLIEDKFTVDFIPHGDPLIYVSQQGEPRVLIFGPRPEIIPGSSAAMWDQTLLVRADEKEVYYYYRMPVETGGPGATPPPVTLTGQGSRRITDVLRYFARRPTLDAPEAGLNLTYSQVVSALAGLHDDQAIEAGFATEQDRMQAELLRASRSAQVLDRPESDTAGPQPWEEMFTPEGRLKENAVPTPTQLKKERSLVVPLTRESALEKNGA